MHLLRHGNREDIDGENIRSDIISLKNHAAESFTVSCKVNLIISNWDLDKDVLLWPLAGGINFLYLY